MIIKGEHNYHAGCVCAGCEHIRDVTGDPLHHHRLPHPCAYGCRCKRCKGKEEYEDTPRRPAYYTRGKVELWDFLIEQYGTDWLVASAIQYLIRYKHKGEPIRDLEKALVYVEKLLKEERKDGKGSDIDEAQADDQGEDIGVNASYGMVGGRCHSQTTESDTFNYPFDPEKDG